MPHRLSPETRPGDVVGTDSDGRVRIDRVIPLPWVMGIIGAGVMNAAAMYYGQQQLVETVKELKGEVRNLSAGMAAAGSRDVEHSFQIRSLERRVDNLEAKKP